MTDAVIAEKGHAALPNPPRSASPQRESSRRHREVTAAIFLESLVTENLLASLAGAHPMNRTVTLAPLVSCFDITVGAFSADQPPRREGASLDCKRGHPAHSLMTSDAVRLASTK